MKKLIIVLALMALLTGCFGEKEVTNDEWVESPVVEETTGTGVDDSDVPVEWDEDTKDDENLWEVESDTNNDTVSDENTTGDSETSTDSEDQDTQEVLDEFEDDLDDIFKDLGL